jgi:hypothetical protein
MLMNLVAAMALLVLASSWARAADPLTPGRTARIKVRSLMLTFSGRVPGGAAINSTTRLAKGWALDAGIGVARPVGSAFLGTLAIPAVMYAEFGTAELLRAGIGYTWTPLRNDGMALLSVGYMSANPTEDIAFGVDLTWTPDRRLAAEPFYYFTVIGLSVGIRL